MNKKNLQLIIPMSGIGKRFIDAGYSDPKPLIEVDGYPIIKHTAEGDPVVKDVVQMEIPYLKDEVISIINWLHENRDQIKKK